jgi:hypothetical protein
MRTVKQSNDRYKPDTWKGVTRDGVHGAGYTCPNGHTGSLTDHTIASDGTVAPSVVCPEDGCNFHEYIQLEGWSGMDFFKGVDMFSSRG